MNIIDRLRIRFGIVKDDNANIVFDDIFLKFEDDIKHTEGNAVELEISSSVFTEVNMSEMLSDGLIYSWHRKSIPGIIEEDINADFVVYSDTDRLKKFDKDVLKQLHMGSSVRPAQFRSWYQV